MQSIARQGSSAVQHCGVLEFLFGFCYIDMIESLAIMLSSISSSPLSLKVRWISRSIKPQPSNHAVGLSG